jgi:hypothetical protein
VSTVTARGRLFCAARLLRAHFPAEMAARLTAGSAELQTPERPCQVAVSRNADATPCNPPPREAVASAGFELLLVRRAARLAVGPVELRPPERALQVAVSKNPEAAPCNSLLPVGSAPVQPVAPVSATGLSDPVKSAPEVDPVAGNNSRTARCGFGRPGGKPRPMPLGREAERPEVFGRDGGQAPWRQAIAFARAAKRAERAAHAAARTAARTERAAAQLGGRQHGLGGQARQELRCQFRVAIAWISLPGGNSAPVGLACVRLCRGLMRWGYGPVGQVARRRARCLRPRRHPSRRVDRPPGQVPEGMPPGQVPQGVPWSAARGPSPPGWRRGLQVPRVASPCTCLPAWSLAGNHEPVVSRARRRG